MDPNPNPIPAPPAPPAPPSGNPPSPNPNPGQTFEKGGQTDSGNVGQYVAVVLIALTFLNLMLQISLNRKQHAAIGKTDEKNSNDIKELKLNVRKLMGDKYEQLV